MNFTSIGGAVATTSSCAVPSTSAQLSARPSTFNSSAASNALVLETKTLYMLGAATLVSELPAIEDHENDTVTCVATVASSSQNETGVPS